jgi:teichoic acid transport system permease protein
LSDLTQLAKEHGLFPIGTRPAVGQYIRDAWRRRGFAATLARYRLIASTARSRLGAAWIVIVPSLQILTYGLIFGLVLGSSRPDNFLPYLVVGVVIFQMLAGAFSDGARSITSNVSLARTLNFPRVLLPLAALIAQFLKSAGLILLMLLVLPLLGEMPNWNWFLLIPTLLLALLFGFGVALIAARLTVQLEDLSQLIPFVTRVAFYASGVFFSFDKLADAVPWIGALEWANPVALFLALGRSGLVAGYEVPGWYWPLALAWGVLTVIVGFVFFYLAEERYGRG